MKIALLLKKRVGKMKDKINEFESEGILTMLASEKLLNDEWDNKYDERWNLII